jgi:hypothetical protein
VDRVAALSLGQLDAVSKITARKSPVELWPIWELDKIQPSRRARTGSIATTSAATAAPIPLLPDDVVHFMFPDPSNPFWGTRRSRPRRASSTPTSKRCGGTR